MIRILSRMAAVLRPLCLCAKRMHRPSRRYDEFWLQMERDGVIRLPVRPVPDSFLREPPAKAKGSALEALLDERRNSR